MKRSVIMQLRLRLWHDLLKYGDHAFISLFYSHYGLILMSGLELAEETHIIFREHAQVLDLVLEIGDALDTHTESITGINVGIYAASFENIRINHTATENLDPSRTLAEGASLAPAYVATYIHLGRGFGEWEIRGTQTDFGLRAEHLTRESEKHLFEIGKRDTPVYIQSFDLMEKAVGAR